ncbi:MAG: hypothetical protein VST67_06465, partial [Nitrospirota bacterium]|nr:hypothetical protein [Nitrospirota bacterium]
NSRGSHRKRSEKRSESSRFFYSVWRGRGLNAKANGIGPKALKKKLWAKPVVLMALVTISCANGTAGQMLDIEEDIPKLTNNDAISLVSTYLHPHLVSGDPLFRCMFAGDRSASYRGDEMWVVEFTGCTFVVNDRTGKVTGP